MHSMARGVRRRDFLVAAAAGAVATAALPGRLNAAQSAGTEAANIKIVSDMCAAWTAPMDLQRVRPFLADDCVYRATEAAPPRTGRDTIIEWLQRFADVTFCEFEVVETFARGPIVVNERIDRFVLPARRIEWHGVGVFYIEDGKIAEWSDFTIV